MGSYNDVFNELQDYILDEERINKSIKLKLLPVKQEPVKIAPRPAQKPALFIPSQ